MNPIFYVNESIEEVKKDWQYLSVSDRVKVIINVEKIGNYLLPKKTGKEKVIATFKRMDYGSYDEIDRDCTIIVESDDFGEKQETDYSEMKKLILKRMLQSWTLDVPLEHNKETDWLTDECWEKVKSIPAPLANALVTSYEKTIFIDDEETKLMDRQAAILFGRNSSGVANACDAIRLYCTLNSFWEKFGINRFDITKLSYKEFMQLRIMVHKENESRAAEMRRSQNAKGTSVMQGGRTRGSQAIRIPE